MAQGTLEIFTTMGQEALAVGGVSFLITDKQGNNLYQGVTDENGKSGVYVLDAPDPDLSLNPAPGVQPYSLYDVWLGKPYFTDIRYIDVQVFADQDAVLPANMLPLGEGDAENEQIIVIPPPTAQLPTYTQDQQAPEDVPATSPLPRGWGMPVEDFTEPQDNGLRILPDVIMPDYVTVHLGTPSNTSANNVRVRFIDYVKNVVCSEIYPTWPVNAIIANVHCIVSLVLNRIYTEWYRSRGYPYDITNSTTVDQYFVYGRNIFQNISTIVDGVFNVYVRRTGFRNPYYTEYCNGTTATCKGLSQWGTVALAESGYTPIQILRNYYPIDLELVAAPSGNNIESYPGTALSVGSSGDDVRRMQEQLNRIRADYPLIPQIANPNGYFGTDTQNAVKVFQKTFNLTQDGIIGRSTWNKISQIYVAVTKLAELGSEGERIGLSPTPPTVTIRQGSRGTDVNHAQFLLNYISQYYPEIPTGIVDSVFGASTTAAVKIFQTRFGLAADGIVGPATWSRMYEIANGVINQQPPSIPSPITPVSCAPYPGYLLRQGSRGGDVITLQNFLNKAHQVYSAVPLVTADGIFGAATAAAVRTFQLYSGLTVDGVVGPTTWSALTRIACA